ncbi:MAG: O-antigen ligase family protein [Alphaproteobacteria bacterium]
MPSATGSRGLGLAAVLTGVVAPFAPMMMAPLAGLAAALGLVDLVRRRLGLQAFTSAFGVFVFVLLGWMLASGSWAIGLELAASTFGEAGLMLMSAVLLVASARRVGDDERARLARAIAVGFALLVLCLAVEALSRGFVLRTVAPGKLGDRAWSNAWISRGLVVMALMLWPTLVALRRLGWRKAAPGAVALALVLVYIGRHNSTLVALAAGLATFALVYAFGRPAVVALGALCIAFALANPLLVMGPLSPESAAAVLDPIDRSAAHRLYIWSFVTERIMERPWLGWGLGSSRIIPGADGLTPVGGTNVSLHPHSAPLQLWLELGVGGVLMLAALVVLVCRAISRLDDRFDRAAAAAMLSVGFVLGALAFGVWQGWWIGALGLLAAWLIALVARPAGAGDPRAGRA